MRNNATAELDELYKLQSELINLSQEIDEVCEFIETDLRNLNYFWDDRKFDELVESITPKLIKIKMISESYYAWAKTDLQEHINHVIDILNGSNMG